LGNTRAAVSARVIYPQHSPPANRRAFCFWVWALIARAHTESGMPTERTHFVWQIPESVHWTYGLLVRLPLLAMNLFVLTSLPPDFRIFQNWRHGCFPASPKAQGEATKRSIYSEEQMGCALLLAESETQVVDVCCQIGVSGATKDTWKRKLGNLGMTEFKRRVPTPISYGTIDCTPSALLLANWRPHTGAKYALFGAKRVVHRQNRTNPCWHDACLVVCSMKSDL
jgi:hypothetical protein